MRARTPQHALLAFILRAAASPAGINIPCPVCGDYFDPSDPGQSYPHNNH